jgi:hypothetical protein
MEPSADPGQAMVEFLSHWLADGEVRSWQRACARYAASPTETGEPADPWEVVRAALAGLLEAKELLGRYRENAQECPDPFTPDLLRLLRSLPPPRPGTRTAPGPRDLLRIHTQELLERCQRPPRRVSADDRGAEALRRLLD